jgi:hypothetical protein
MAWPALTGPTPYRLVRPGAMSSTMASSCWRLSLSCPRAWASASARRQISAWRTACSRLASAGSSRAARAVLLNVLRAALRSVSSPASSRARRLLACAVAATVISWQATSRMRSASPSPSARGTESRLVSRRSAASTARWASMGSDLPFPRRCLRPGCSYSITRTRRPAAASVRASPIPGLARRDHGSGCSSSCRTALSDSGSVLTPSGRRIGEVSLNPFTMQ